MSINYFKKVYKGVILEVDDLFLLESFQIAYIPGWIPEPEFAVVLKSRPEIKRYLVKRCPEIAGFVESVLHEHGERTDLPELQDCYDTVVWTIADTLVYNKCPEVYDRLPFHGWDFAEITSLVNLKAKIIIDGGAGTGRVALEAAETAAMVFAVEPVTRRRELIRSRAKEKSFSNCYVVDGSLHHLPFPDSFADVLITSHALGWELQDELAEFERVVKKGGMIIHCPGTAVGAEEDQHRALVESPWSYEFSTYDEADGPKRKYWKTLP
jgi:SAM-dependent methyltransferase